MGSPEVLFARTGEQDVTWFNVIAARSSKYRGHRCARRAVGGEVLGAAGARARLICHRRPSG
ncbi:hypothetical protein ACIA8C_25530 [Nocardia sp. NPDC051321]|uniref:hypothetical protein n=1 Tax=Nocardia sp. NPDC051321 TaxID=3364323 RepID=UPI0037AB08F6